MRDSLDARYEALRSDLVVARTHDTVTQVTAFLFSVLAVFPASRLTPYRRHPELR
ncbi:hypothetical protein Ait01nite_023620 [Actinoplanes italicus]|uniref:Uncharacterized protein n=1 Tax=Actinoplanes italicus TaxID=113567 RepID=A0A2T0KFV9_9ACTN|nr:hypothetical protein CLV67_105439 [Actinoplanes italicus]GIE29317.1 hypothetical protein Ait01nite_023620 [Actinoplanes italicus]